jgi:hypothetical protein
MTFADPPSNQLVVRARFGFIFGGMVQFEPEVVLDTLPVLGFGKQAGGNYTATDDLVDLNADGLPDAVTFDLASATVSVSFNLGNGVWESQPTHTYSFAADPFGSFLPPRLSRINEEAPPVGGVSATSIVAQLTDLNGDGNLDFVSAQLQPPLSPSILARQMAYRPTRKMVRATSLDNNVETNVTYAFRNGTAPYPVHVVASSTRTRTPLYTGEPVRNRTVTMQYTQSAMGFDRKFRQFTGFGGVLAMGDTFATHSMTTYATDYYQSGLVLERVAENNVALGALERIVNTYETVVLENPERKFTKLVQTHSNPGLMRTMITRHVEHGHARRGVAGAS